MKIVVDSRKFMIFLQNKSADEKLMTIMSVSNIDKLIIKNQCC